jgi:uncharacterized protein YebE (UPF0316 family)
MTFVFTQEAILIALGIFALRVLNQSLDTLRVMMMMRGRNLITWMLGFAETVIFVITLSTVINDLNNILNIVAYSAGFATGNVTGLWIEGRLAMGHIHMRVVSPKRGSKVAETLRAEGYAVTEIPARGRDGAVTLLNASVRRKDVSRVRQIVQDVDEGAFITGEDMRPIGRGFWGN